MSLADLSTVFLTKFFRLSCCNTNDYLTSISFLRRLEAQTDLAFLIKSTDIWPNVLIHYRPLSKYMKIDLVESALQVTINIRRPEPWLMFHSDLGSKYKIGRFSQLLIKYKIMASMSSVGTYLDNVVVERFSGSLKNEWLLNVVHLTRNEMKIDVEEYIRYYNYARLHTTLGNLTPINYENL